MEWTEAKKRQLVRASCVIVTLLLGITGVTDIALRSNLPQHHAYACPIKVCNVTEEPLTDINATDCSYIKQFVLGNGKRLTVCKYLGVTRIDIRQFMRGRVTIQGIWLRHKEWKSLLDRLPDIMLALSQSKKLYKDPRYD